MSCSIVSPRISQLSNARWTYPLHAAFQIVHPLTLASGHSFLSSSELPLLIAPTDELADCSDGICTTCSLERRKDFRKSCHAMAIRRDLVLCRALRRISGLCGHRGAADFSVDVPRLADARANQSRHANKTQKNSPDLQTFWEKHLEIRLTQHSVDH